ncbi:MAG: branched-chain amino acid ABC transporter permease [Deltaproteobacteria bacterium]|nr:branched-chain amino acid ABC transporter permease [Deltaproteobacteria bacterium]
MNTTTLIMMLFNGLVFGSYLVLLSLGLSIIFGMLGVVNFAQGALYMLGAYAGYTCLLFGLNFWVALLVAPLMVAFIAMLAERFLIRHLYKEADIYVVLLTFGLMLVFEEVIRLIFGDLGRPIAIPDLLSGVVNLGFMYYPKYRLFIIGVTALCALGTWLFLIRTKLGSIIRAGTDDSEMVDALGIHISRIYTGVFAFGAGLAGLAGILAGPLQEVTPLMGNEILIQIFVVVVIGGLGSIAGSIVAGLLIGEIITLGVLFWPTAAMTSIYVLMAIVLLIRPRGFFGRAGFHE